mmetsp:Transcript_9553/g.29634  ORF Transcript_9553/g.29634 Transcript_9553/m.29634 type:complete len:220 (+) Transcript_9553:243-902(+)
MVVKPDPHEGHWQQHRRPNAEETEELAGRHDLLLRHGRARDEVERLGQAHALGPGEGGLLQRGRGRHHAVHGVEDDEREVADAQRGVRRGHAALDDTRPHQVPLLVPELAQGPRPRLLHERLRQQLVQQRHECREGDEGELPRASAHEELQPHAQHYDEGHDTVGDGNVVNRGHPQGLRDVPGQPPAVRASPVAVRRGAVPPGPAGLRLELEHPAGWLA